MRRSGVLPLLLPALLAFLLSLILFGLQYRSLYVGQAQSYDTLLYARSLWGIGAGEPLNTVYGTHWLGIHANLTLVLLAPLAQLMEPTTVLLLGQALSFLVVVGGVGWASATEALRAGRRLHGAAALGVGVGALFGLGSALVANPFLFDPRPDAMGAAMATAGMLMVWSRGRWSAGAVALMVAAVLTREEFIVCFASAMAIPWIQRRADTAVGHHVTQDNSAQGNTGGSDKDRSADTGVGPRVAQDSRAEGKTEGLSAGRAAWVAFGLCTAWAAVYVLVIRGLFVSDEAALAAGERAREAADALFGVGDAATWAYRAAVLAGTLGTAGGLAVGGWRMLLAGLPALLFVLAIDKGGMDALKYHYALLLVPTLAVATVMGVSAWIRKAARRPMAWLPAVLLLVAMVQSWGLSSWPWGRLYDPVWYGWNLSAPEQIAVGRTRSMLSQIPPGEGVAAPYMLAAAEADRANIWSDETLLRTLNETQAIPESVQWVLLSARHQSRARYLVTRQGFVLTSQHAGIADLLSRRPDATLDERVRESLRAPAEVGCTEALAQFSSAGLTVCAVARGDDDRLHVAVKVEAGALAPSEPTVLMARNAEMMSAVSFAWGMVLPHQLGEGMWLALSDQPWASGQQPGWVLATLSGGMINPDSTP
jgi:hypothetical protein